jgi:hypothetical protein
MPPPVTERAKLINEALDALEDAERSVEPARTEKAKHAEGILESLACTDACDAGLVNYLADSLEAQSRYGRALSVYETFASRCPPPVRTNAPYTEAQRRYAELRRLPKLAITILPADARVTVNDRSWDELREGMASASLRSGKYVVRAVAEHHTALEETVNLNDGDERKLDLKLLPESSSKPPNKEDCNGDCNGDIKRTLAWASLVGAGVALTSGTVVLLVRNGEVKEYNSNSSCLGENEPNPSPACASKLDTANGLTTASTTLFLGAGIFGSLAAVLFAITPPAQPSPAAAIPCGPWGTRGVSCRGVF